MSDVDGAPAANNGAATELLGTFGQSKRYRATGRAAISKAYRMITTKAELNRYFEMIDRRVPIGVSRFIRWLRIPSSFAVRLAIAVLLILGGIFSFLPILGIW